MSEQMTIRRGTELELDIKSLAYGGMGVAKVDNFVIFVKSAIPGEKIIARIYKKRKGPNLNQDSWPQKLSQGGSRHAKSESEVKNLHILRLETTTEKARVLILKRIAFAA